MDQTPEDLTVDEFGWGTELLTGGRKIKWRFHFYEEPIDDEELRGVAVFTNGKLAQTPFFFNLVGGLNGQPGLEYLSGVVEADYLDELDKDIIAPERQRVDWNLIESKPLLDWGKDRIKSLLRVWKLRRQEKKGRVLVDEASFDHVQNGCLHQPVVTGGRHDRSRFRRLLPVRLCAHR